MKKTFSGIIAILLAITVISSCKKGSSSPDCAAMGTSVANAITAYNSNPSSENCVALQSAYRDYLNSSCIPESERATTQQQLELLETLCE